MMQDTARIMIADGFFLWDLERRMAPRRAQLQGLKQSESVQHTPQPTVKTLFNIVSGMKGPSAPWTNSVTDAQTMRQATGNLMGATVPRSKRMRPYSDWHFPGNYSPSGQRHDPCQLKRELASSAECIHRVPQSYSRL
jgi:hypothetical protein